MFLFFFQFAVSSFRTDHAVSISVSAPWSSVRLVDQIFSFCVHYSNSMTKKFISKATIDASKMNDADYLWGIVNETVPSRLIPILRANIDFGSQIPSAVFNGFSNDPERGRGEVKNGYVYETDFVNGDEINSSKNIYYLDLIKDARMIQELIRKDGPFIIRSTPPEIGKKSFLRGFDIELRPFKYSMEYGVKDQGENKTATDQQKGINNKYEDETTKNLPNSFEENISLIDFDQFDMKFVSFLSENREKRSFLSILRDVTNNWPLYLKAISESKPENQTINKIRDLFSQHNHCFNLNGRDLPNDIDIFTLLQNIDEERSLRDLLLERLIISENKINKFVKEPLPDISSFYFDFESGNVVDYFNDIATDKEYSEWSNNVNDLYNYRNTMPQVRQNIFINILYIDPSTADGLNHLITLYRLLKSMNPVTLGMVPRFRMNDPLSRKVGFAYHHLALKNKKAAFGFLIRSFQYANFESEESGLSDLTVSEAAFAKAYDEFAISEGKCKRWNDLHDLYEPSSFEYQRIKRNANYYRDTNLKEGKVSSNGLIVDAPNDIYLYQNMMIRSFNVIVPLLLKERFYELRYVNITKALKSAKIVLNSTNDAIHTSNIETFDLFSQKYEKQVEFVDSFKNIKWENNIKNANSYAFIFCDENTTDLSVFKDFINSFSRQKHYSSILFSINPEKTLFRFQPKDFPVLVINGRILRKFDVKSKNLFNLVDRWNYHFILKHIQDILGSSNKPEVFFYVSSILNSWISKKIVRNNINEFIFHYNSTLTYSENHSDLDLSVVMNPFDRDFQRFSGILEYLSSNKVLNVGLCLNLNFPNLTNVMSSTITSTAVFSYFRNSINSESVVFTHISDSTTYSSLINVPNSWQVETLVASFDIDNILLRELSPKVHKAEYVLTNVIVEGSCSKVEDNSIVPLTGKRIYIYPNRGHHTKQLKYYDLHYASQSNTLVMGKQDGYFQLMGTIGPNFVYFDNSTKGSIENNEERNIIEVNSFAQKKYKITSTDDGYHAPKSSNYANSSRVDVFCVASGHLYERLVKIMMISVKKQTKSKVTFWILNNFLSPQFKASLPQMAAKYDFEFSLVKYKWPDWIFPQNEKQRIIWGNKILFLDVIFPTDLDRVIYIDADQIVRTDMSELMRMDFKGAPYAFTPFCDSRKETEPFRFWKTGYWRNLLRDKKYHISALFAIDLQTFREMRAGDILRNIYQMMAPDGHSLSNLDQDLPNYAQLELPIFSLPQNWLWCETWCSDETMDQAKTIDLCNNPLTKIPKLEIAKERVAEWPGLDEEAKEISATTDGFEKLFFSQ